jgi:hypothetical protein
LTSLKTDTEIKKQFPDVIRLSLIAELFVCIDIIDKVIIFANKNSQKTFYECLINLKLNKQLDNTRDTNSNSSNKRQKIKLHEDSDDEYESSEDIEDDEDEDEWIEINDKNSKDFIQQIFHNNDDDVEKEISKHYNKLPCREKKDLMNEIKSINPYQSNNKPILLKLQ